MPNRRLPGTILLAAGALAACASAPKTSSTTAAAAADAPGGWVVQPSGTAASLRGVRAVSAQVAWASGSRGTVLRTTDGGATWQPLHVLGGDSLDFRSLAALDANTAYVASAGDGAAGQARIYKTTDGGATWSLALSDTTAGVFFDALAFWDANHGLVISDPVRGRFVVAATSNGGRTWGSPGASAMPAARAGEAAFAAGGAALAIAAPRHAWFVTGGTSGARIFHSEDGGGSWRAEDAPTSMRGASAGLFAVAFRNARMGIAVGGDYRLAREGDDHAVRSDDGGLSWRIVPASPGVTGYWSGLSYVPGAGRPVAVAVGGAGTTISRDDGATWTRVDSTEYNAVSFAAPDAGWAVGPRGRIAHWQGRLGR